MSDITGDGFLDMVVGTYVHSFTIIPILSWNFTIPDLMHSNMNIQILPLTNTYTHTHSHTHTHTHTYIHTHTHTHAGTLSGQVHLLKSSVPAHALNSWSSFPNGRLNGFSHGIMGVSVPLEQRVYVTFIFSYLFCLAYPALPYPTLPCHSHDSALSCQSIYAPLNANPSPLPFHLPFLSLPLSTPFPLPFSLSLSGLSRASFITYRFGAFVKSRNNTENV